MLKRPLAREGHTAVSLGYLDFLVIGPEKCGTSWLDKALRAVLPNALPYAVKESFFLDRHYHLGCAWHASLFRGQSEVRGEVAPSYFASASVRERLRALAPDCKVLVVLRNPYSRMASHVLHAARRGTFSITAGLSAIPEEVWNEARNSSNYAEHAEAWIENFGQERVGFVCYEDIRLQPARFLNAVLSHIPIEKRIDPGFAEQISNEVVYAAAVPRSVLLKRLIYRTNRHLEALGFTALVSAIRRSPLRMLVEKPANDVDGLKIAIVERISELEDFERAVDFSENALSRDLTHWRRRKMMARDVPS